MKRKFRLTRSTDFQRVRRLGKSYAHPLIVLIALRKEPDEAVRMGVAAGRSVGNAVRRNRAKRRLRAALSLYQSAIPAGWDIVVIARYPLVEASFRQIRGTLETLLRRARLLQASHEDEYSSGTK